MSDNYELLQKSFVYSAPIFLILCVVLIFFSLTTLNIIIKDYQLRDTPSPIFIANLALVDLCLAVFTTFGIFVHVFDIERQIWVVSEMSISVFTTIATLSLLSTFANSIDRYIYIRFSIQYNHIVTVARTKKIILLIWMFSILFGFVPMIVEAIGDDRSHSYPPHPTIRVYGNHIPLIIMYALTNAASEVMFIILFTIVKKRKNRFINFNNSPPLLAPFESNRASKKSKDSPISTQLSLTLPTFRKLVAPRSNFSHFTVNVDKAEASKVNANGVHFYRSVQNKSPVKFETDLSSSSRDLDVDLGDVTMEEETKIYQNIKKNLDMNLSNNSFNKINKDMKTSNGDLKISLEEDVKLHHGVSQRAPVSGLIPNGKLLHSIIRPEQVASNNDIVHSPQQQTSESSTSQVESTVDQNEPNFTNTEASDNPSEMITLSTQTIGISSKRRSRYNGIISPGHQSAVLNPNPNSSLEAESQQKLNLSSGTTLQTTVALKIPTESSTPISSNAVTCEDDPEKQNPISDLLAMANENLNSNSSTKQTHTALQDKFCHNKSDFRTAKTLFILLGVYITLWAPSYVLLFLSSVLKLQVEGFFIWAHLLATLNSTIDFFVYPMRIARVRATFLDAWKRFRTTYR